MVRLIHLNGPPGTGKSTVASAFADRHPGVLNLDAVTGLVTLGAVKSAAVQDVDFAGGRWHIFMLAVIVPALASTPVVAGVWLWLAWVNRRGYAWARSAFMAFVGVLTIGWFYVVSVSSGEDATPSTSRDLLVTTALWLVGLVAMTLTFTRRATPCYQRRTATLADGTGR